LRRSGRVSPNPTPVIPCGWLWAFLALVWTRCGPAAPPHGSL